ncbi:MAG: DUF3392 family protein [Chitinispirillaceae bacterium]|nr:DUF3392 family protein [Chitinispirillaceae bacterium]
MVETLLNYIASFIRLYRNEISFGITAVTLMLFGPHLNRSVRRLTRKFAWYVRYAVFILLCTGGYTVLAHVIYSGVIQLIRSSSNLLAVVIILGCYLLLAWIAKEQKAI